MRSSHSIVENKNSLRRAAAAALEMLEPRQLLSAAITFAPPVTYGSSYEPSLVVAGDINGDGIPDLLVANQGFNGGHNHDYPGSITTLLGNGDGTFRSGPTISVYSANSMQLADLAHNGRNDLILPGIVLLNNGDGTFKSGQTFTSGGTIKVADVNGDGKFDIVTVTGDGEISVLLGNGDGTFAAPKTVGATGDGYANSLVVADLNHDGKLDIAVASSAEPSPRISVLLNNGNGTFDAPISYAANDPLGMIALDVNRDGTPDLVVADGAAGFIGAYLGNSNGSFQAESVIARVADPTSITVTDFNGDGYLDLVYTVAPFSNSTYNVGILPGTPGTTFGAPVTLRMGYYPGSVTISDLNLDGRPDLVVPDTRLPSTPASGVIVNMNSTPVSSPPPFAANYDGIIRVNRAPGYGTSDTISIFSNNAGGIAIYESYAGLETFSLNDFSELSIVTGTGSDSITLDAAIPANLGLIHIDASSGRNDTIMALDGNPHSIVGPSLFRSLIVGGPGNDTIDAGITQPTSVDGSTISGGAGNDSITCPSQSIVKGQQGDDTIVCMGDASTVLGGQGNDSLVGEGDDFQGNLIHGGAGNDTIANVFASGADTIVGGAGDNVTVPGVLFNPPATFVGAQLPNQLQLADVNGDGRLDLIETDTKNNSVHVSLGVGNVQFAAPFTLSLGTDAINNIQQVAVADINGDHKPDLLVSYNGTVDVLLGNGDGTFKAPQTTGIAVNAGFTIADVNHDGKLDVIANIAADDFGSVLTDATVYLGNGTGTFSAGSTYYLDAGAPIITADINGDGKLDIVSGNSILFGNGDGTFKPAIAYDAGGPISSIAAADLNGDGKVDLVVGHSAAGSKQSYGSRNVPVDVLLGNGDGTFASVPLTFSGPTTATFSSEVLIADINGDGHLDIVASSPADGAIEVFLNDGHAHFLEKFISGFASGLIAVGDVTGDGIVDVIDSVGNRRFGVLVQKLSSY